MANRQVRLDPDISVFVGECAFDWEVSVTAATNRLLRAIRDEPPVVPPADPPTDPPTEPPPIPVPAPAPPTASQRASTGRSAFGRVTPRGENPRLAAILRTNAQQL